MRTDDGRAIQILLIKHYEMKIFRYMDQEIKQDLFAMLMIQLAVFMEY